MRISKILMLFAAFSMLTPPLIPCPCVTIPSPCEAVHQSPAAFLATAMRTVDQGRYAHTILHVDRSFVGQVPSEITYAAELLPGAQYLVYASQRGEIFHPVFCQAALEGDEAREHLEFLDAFSRGRTTTTVSGSVELEHSREPLSNVVITLASSRGNYETSTNGSGQYSFAGIPPGEYQLRAELAGFAVWRDHEVTVKSGACTAGYIAMAVDRRIHGTVRSTTGTPVKDARVMLVAVTKDGSTEILRDTRTDEAGEYALRVLDSGEYYLGINIGVTPQASSPHVPTYYPSARQQRDAVRIFVPDAAAQLRYDLTEPERLPVVTVRGRALLGDGRPAPEGTIISLAGEDLREPLGEDIRPRADGVFEFQYCKALRFHLDAFAYRLDETTSFVSETQTGMAGEDKPVQLILTERSNR